MIIPSQRVRSEQMNSTPVWPVSRLAGGGGISLMVTRTLRARNAWYTMLCIGRSAPASMRRHASKNPFRI